MHCQEAGGQTVSLEEGWSFLQILSFLFPVNLSCQMSSAAAAAEAHTQALS